MNELTFIDESTITSTDRLCFMILDHLKRQEDEFEKFKNEYMDSKRIEKLNEIKKEVMKFICRETTTTYNEDNNTFTTIEDNPRYNVSADPMARNTELFHTDEKSQLIISICIKNLPFVRIKSIWKKLFPSKEIDLIIDEWIHDGYCHNSHHIIKGVDLNSIYKDHHLKTLDKYTYSKDEINMLLNELSLSELVNITPRIKTVIYKHVYDTYNSRL